MCSIKIDDDHLYSVVRDSVQSILGLVTKITPLAKIISLSFIQRRQFNYLLDVCVYKVGHVLHFARKIQTIRSKKR